MNFRGVEIHGRVETCRFVRVLARVTRRIAAITSISLILSWSEVCPQDDMLSSVFIRQCLKINLAAFYWTIYDIAAFLTTGLPLLKRKYLW